MQEIARQSLGHYKIGPGTLYDNLQRLLDAGLVTDSGRDSETDPRRRYYRLTGFGRTVLSADLERLETPIREAKRMEKELTEARAFQQSLLPPPQDKLAGISVFARYIPCSELAGDFYDYAASGPDSVTLLVVDVSGHGASAAMLTGIVKRLFIRPDARVMNPYLLCTEFPMESAPLTIIIS